MSPRYTGPQIHIPGGHVHEVEALLGIEDTDFTYFNPGSYEIGARASSKLLSIPAHERYYPGDPEGEYGVVEVQAHKRHYPDVWGEIGASVPPIPHYEMGASVPPIPHVELGARRFKRKLIDIPGHERGWPNAPGEYLDVAPHSRQYPDVWGEETYAVGRLEIGAAERAFDKDPPRLTGKVRTFVKKGKLIAISNCFVPSTGGSMLVAIKIPMSTIRKLDPGANASTVSGDWDLYERPVEIGWGWKKYVKKALTKTINNPAFKLIAKKSTTAAKYIAKKAKKTARNPYVQKYGRVASVAVATYYGVPPQVSMAATNTVFDAMNGDPVSMDKIANIAQEAAAGNETAQKLKGLMGILYKGGMKDMKPYLEQAQQAGLNRFAQTSEQMKIEAAKRLPEGFALPGKYAGMFPFEIPGFSYGPPISGWLYNIPYRSNLAARSIDTTNPFHMLRGAYAKGMA